MAEDTRLTTESEQYLTYIEQLSEQITDILLVVTTAEAARRAHRRIRELLNQAKTISFSYVDSVYPRIYLDGLTEAEALMSGVSYIFEATDAGIHNTIVGEAARGMKIDFAKSLDAVDNGVQQAVSQATRTQIRASLVASQSRAEVKQAIKNIFLEQGTKGLVDRGGRSWTLDRYADMLVRTKERESFNSGMVNRALEAGITVFEVSSTGSRHNECAQWEGKLLSANGEYGLPTIAQAESTGLFHPNCQHKLFAAPAEQMGLDG